MEGKKKMNKSYLKSIGLGVLLYFILSTIGYGLHLLGIPNTGFGLLGASGIAVIITYVYTAYFLNKKEWGEILIHSTIWAIVLFLFDLFITSHSNAWPSFWRWEVFAVYALIIITPSITVSYLKKSNKAKKNLILSFLFLVIALLFGGMLVAKQCMFQQLSEEENELKILIVARGEVLVENNTLKIDPELLEWFSDRPQHQAGKMKINELVSMWDAAYKSSPPNAAIVSDDVDAVVVLDDISVDGDTINFKYELTSGNLTEGALKKVSIFIDGANYHPKEYVCNIWECDN